MDNPFKKTCIEHLMGGGGRALGLGLGLAIIGINSWVGETVRPTISGVRQIGGPQNGYIIHI